MKFISVAVALSSTVALSACGGVTVFSGQTPITVAGNAPPPPAPPPEPKKEEPPPPPARVELRDNKIEIREKIQFEVNKAVILPQSFSLLNEIADVIKKNPHIKKIAIEGHASAEGDKAHNLKLSDDRAKSVMKYLTEHGVEAPRLTAKGFGVTKPIADNNTEEGKEKNRRVEFNVVEQDVTKKKVEIDPATGKEKVVEEQKLTEKKPEEAAPTAEKDKKAAAAAAAKKSTTPTPATGTTPAGTTPATPAPKAPPALKAPAPAPSK